MDLHFEIRLPPDRRFAAVAGAALAELGHMNGGPGDEMERLAPLLTEAIVALQAGSNGSPAGACLVLSVTADTTHFKAEVSSDPPAESGPGLPEALLTRLRQAFDHVQAGPGDGWLKVERKIPA